MDVFLTGANVLAVKEILEKPVRCMEMVDYNYRLALRHFADTGLRSWLETLVIDTFGAA